MSSDLERAAQVCDNEAAFHTYGSPNDFSRKLEQQAKFLAAKIRALSPAQPEGWVSVRKRLPDRGSIVLIGWGNSNLPAVAKFGGKRWIDPHNRDEDFALPSRWQPLPAPPRDETKDTDGQSGLSTSPSNEGDAGRPGQTDSSVPRDTLPEDAKLLPARLRAIADGLKETSLNISGRNCEEAASCIETLVAITARLQAELEEARKHGHVHSPTIERIKQAHSLMSREGMSSGDYYGHRVYAQRDDEQCYLCALVAIAEAAERTVGELREALTGIANWRERATAYDNDMGHEPRNYCEDVSLIEYAATAALAPRET